MQPVRMKTDVPTDLEGLRAMLMAFAPRLEAQQPGITAQLQAANMRDPMRLVARSGEAVQIQFEPQAAGTAIKVEVTPANKPVGKLRASFWRWRTRLVVSVMLKRAKQSAQKRTNAAIEPTVMP